MLVIMGRRGVHPNQHERWVFNRLAGAYAHRPGYPDALVERLGALAGGGRRVAELGAGTGHLALALARAGWEVAAVEPARAMLDALVRHAAGLRVRAVHAAGEQTGLEPGAFDLVVVADAIHWMDPQLAGAEAARLLRPGGVAAVIEPAFADTPFMRGVGELLGRYNPKARRPPSRAAGEQFLRLATGGASSAEETFRQDVPLEPAALEGVLRSLSFAGPALGEEKLSELIAHAQALAAREGGAVWSRELRLSWAVRAVRRG